MQQECSEIEQLESMSKAELVTRWPEIFDSPMPQRVSPNFLRMALAWKLQTTKHRVITSKLDRRLRQITEAIADGRTPRALTAGPDASVGATIVRTWRGKVYPVTVIKDGFVFDGVTYASLSEIARKITGTRWNGPAFFGLRKGQAAKAAGGSCGK